MAHIPAENTVRVCMRYTRKGQQVCNVFHVQYPARPTVADMNDLGAALVDWFDTDVKTYMHTDTSLEAIEMRDLTADPIVGVDYTAGLPIAGTTTGATLPNNVTVVTKLLTGLAGRSYRGRWYWNGLAASSVEADDTLTAGAQVIFTNLIAELVSDIALLGAEMVIASFTSGGAPRTDAVLTPVTNAQTNPTLDSQRRRLPERGI